MLRVRIFSLIKKLLDIRFIIVLFVFISVVMIEKPGLYLDAVNPDYMGLSLLHSENVPKWAYSDNVIATMIEGGKEYSHFPLLNSLYGTCFEMYTTLLWSVFFGYSVFSIRTLHIVYFVVLLLGIYTFSKHIWGSNRIACVVTLLLAIDPSFMFSSRTQFYIQLFPHMTFFFGLLLIIKAIEEDYDNNKYFSGMVLLGLSACSYFVFAFYFVGVAFGTFILIFKRKGWVRQSIKMILGFLLGYMPYIYAHISIMLTQGIGGWISAIKGLDTYGLSDGAQASIQERIVHIVESIGNILGGNVIIHTMTGYDIGNVWGELLAVIYMISVVLAVFLIIKCRHRVIESRKYIALFYMLCIFLFHFLLALMVGNALGYQHFIMLLPVMILTIILAFNVLFDYMRDKENLKAMASVMQRVVILTTLVYALISFGRIFEGYSVINQTGGVAYYSEAVNNMAYYIEGVVSEDDTIICPQWGYWMQIACITNGRKTLWIDSDSDTLQWRMDNNPKSGDYYVIIDNKTDVDMVEQLMKSHGYLLSQTEAFIDYGQVLSPSIQIYEKAGDEINGL